MTTSATNGRLRTLIGQDMSRSRSNLATLLGSIREPIGAQFKFVRVLGHALVAQSNYAEHVLCLCLVLQVVIK